MKIALCWPRNFLAFGYSALHLYRAAGCSSRLEIVPSELAPLGREWGVGANLAARPSDAAPHIHHQHFAHLYRVESVHTSKTQQVACGRMGICLGILGGIIGNAT